MRRARFRGTIDRAGWALAMGLGVCGAAVMVVAWGAGASWSGGGGIGLVGAVIGAIVIVGIAMPIWLAVGRRGPVAAGAIGAGVAAIVTIAALTRGFGLSLPASDGATLGMVWTSAIATAAVAGFLGGLLALAMWLVAYRAG